MPDPTPAERREAALIFAGDIARGHYPLLDEPVRNLAAAVRDLADENERLRAWKAEALAVLAQWDEVHAALGSPGRLGQSMAVASREQVERLRGELRDEVAFWDDFYDEAFTDEPFIWGRVRGEIDRRRAALTEEPQP